MNRGDGPRQFELQWFDSSWNRLREGVESRVALALNEERDLEFRADITTLSWQLQLLGDRLGKLLAVVFGTTRIRGPGNFRGYFLTGRGGEKPSEDLLGDYLCQRYHFTGIRPRAPVSNSLPLFSSGLVSGVLLPEAGVAGRNHRRVWQWRTLMGVWAAGCLAMLLLMVTWLYQNQRYLYERGELAVSALNQMHSPIPDGLVPGIRWMANLQNILEQYRHPLPWYVSPWFMHHGPGKQLESLWQARLTQVVRPRLQRWLTARVIEDSGTGRPDRLVTYLQLYLALTGQKSLHPTRPGLQLVIRNLLTEKNYGMEAELMTQLEAMLANPGTPAERNSEFMDRIRNRWESLGDGAVYIINMSNLLGFTRVPMSSIFNQDVLNTFEADPELVKDGFPSMYTARAAAQMQISSEDPAIKVYMAVRQALFHPQFPDVTKAEKLAVIRNIQEVYFLRYTRFWQEFLGSLKLQPINSREQLLALLMGLSTSGESPLESLIKTVVANTRLNLQTAAGQPAAVELLAGSKAAAKNKVVAEAGSHLPQTDNIIHADDLAQEMARRFSDYSRLIDDKGKGGSLIGRLEQQMGQFTGAVQPALVGAGAGSGALKLLASASEDDLKSLPWPAGIIETFPETPRRLMHKVLEVSAQTLFQGATTRLDYLWRRDIAPLWRNSLQGYYPFNSQGQDADPAIVERFFASGGVIDQFVNQNLKPFVERHTGNDGEVVFLPKEVLGQKLPMSDEFWQQLSQVNTVRKVLFSGRDRLGISLPVQVVTMSPQITMLRLDSDSGVLTNRHDPAIWQTFVWQGNNPDIPLTLSLFNGDLLLAEQTWHGIWRWFRWLDAGGGTEVSRGLYRMTFRQRDYRVEFRVRTDTPRLPGRILVSLQLPERML